MDKLFERDVEYLEIVDKVFNTINDCWFNEEKHELAVEMLDNWYNNRFNMLLNELQNEGSEDTKQAIKDTSTVYKRVIRTLDAWIHRERWFKFLIRLWETARNKRKPVGHIMTGIMGYRNYLLPYQKNERKVTDREKTIIWWGRQFNLTMSELSYFTGRSKSTVHEVVNEGDRDLEEDNKIVDEAWREITEAFYRMITCRGGVKVYE